MLIAFEGIDGSGKTTLAKQVFEHFENKIPTVLFKEPAYFVEEIKHASSPYERLMLFMAARVKLMNECIKPFTDGSPDRLVLLDRYIYSTYVYQGLCERIDIEWINELLQTLEIPEPDITVLCEVDADTARGRWKSAPIVDKTEEIIQGYNDFLVSGHFNNETLVVLHKQDHPEYAINTIEKAIQALKELWAIPDGIKMNDYKKRARKILASLNVKFGSSRMLTDNPACQEFP